MEISTVVWLVVGTAVVALSVGATVAWLAASTRASGQRRRAELKAVEQHAENSALRSEAAGLREQVEAIRVEAASRLTEAKAEHQARLAEIKADQAAEQARFRSVATDALAANSKQFLDLAQQTMRASTVKNEEVLVQREQAIRALVEPLNLTLEKVQTQVFEAETKRTESTAALTEQLRALETANADLRKGTSDLVTALRSSQTRGAWGELQLRRVVEVAGMLPHVDFETQASVRDLDGALLRPDMVIRLAGGKNVVVDAKVAFVGYLEAQQAEDAVVREERLDAHVRHMRTHMEQLASKRYWDQFSNAPEFVVMFVPAEVFLSAAAERDPSLLEDAVRKNVIIATPMTLVALLRTVAYSWRQEALAENAAEVLKVGKEFYSRLVTMTKHVTQTGRGLTQATENYNKMIASLERNVLTSARRMVELEVVDSREAIEPLSGIDVGPRAITKPELIAADEDRVISISALEQLALEEFDEVAV